ncbi:MAG: hypothetical protein CMH61_00185 [Nanoarchaeota archaeon]|nr:hypothetical protein [Nanoarchaeota archaeon]
MVVFFILYLILRIGINVILPIIFNNAAIILIQLFNLLIMLLLFNVVISLYYNFGREQKIMNSFGKAFTPSKEKFMAFVLQYGVVLIISFLLYPLRDYFFLYPTRQMVIEVIILFAFLTWMRFYLLDVYQSIKVHN